MKRAAGDLANYSDGSLFKEVSKGISLIVESAVNLDEIARQLDQMEEYRASAILQGLAEEEAAKVLILIDLVRCPRGSERRAATAKHFYSHIAKRIYAKTCWLDGIWTFKELCELVREECRPYYLDGPNLVDWIFPNSITAEREQNLYVDYLQELTDEKGDYHWSVPPARPHSLWRHRTPHCLMLSKALLEAGAGSPDGLAEIANVWRDFQLKPGTNRKELRRLIAHTLDRLTKCGAGNGDQSVASLIIASWSFPMWPLTLKVLPRQPNDLKMLRKRRKRTIKLMQETEAKRSPPPAISRSKVEALSDAYVAWESDVDAQNAGSSEGGRAVRARSFSEIEKDYELRSYTLLEGMYRKLNEEERAALLALGWYAREPPVADWPRVYERAIESVSTLDNGYQIGQAIYWLAGLERWEEKPRPFEAGRRFRMKPPSASGRT